MGTTEIKGKPKRVVTLYQGATDVAVSWMKAVVWKNHGEQNQI